MRNLFMKSEEVQQILGVSKSYAYKVIKSMNFERPNAIAVRLRKNYISRRQNDCKNTDTINNL